MTAATDPLRDTTVLVTRPAAQAARLCSRIAALGGTAIEFPTITIEPVESAAASDGPSDLVIFVSANAVRHGLDRVHRAAHTRTAAIGAATAAELLARGCPPDIVPRTGYDSEALLAEPALAAGRGARATIVRGVGGRELLRHTLESRGWVVVTLEVYRRVIPSRSPDDIAHLENRWAHHGVDVITATSVETLGNLATMLTPAGVRLLRATACVVVSDRIARAAAELGISGPLIRAQGPDDDALLDALIVWRQSHPPASRS